MVFEGVFALRLVRRVKTHWSLNFTERFYEEEQTTTEQKENSKAPGENEKPD